VRLGVDRRGPGAEPVQQAVQAHADGENQGWRVCGTGDVVTFDWRLRANERIHKLREEDEDAFVKQAIDDAVVPRLRREHSVYQHLSGEWSAEVIGFDDGEQPLLILEDLSSCDWPPPWDWDPRRVEAVRAALRDIALYPPPPGLDPAAIFGFAEDGWAGVARDSEPFLSLGLCSQQWLDDALPMFLDAANPRLRRRNSVMASWRPHRDPYGLNEEFSLN